MRRLLSLIKKDIKSLDANKIYTVKFMKDDQGKTRIIRRHLENAE